MKKNIYYCIIIFIWTLLINFNFSLAIEEEIDPYKNSNLENLAIEGELLYPPFDKNITNYNIEVPNTINELNILAIPENEKATVKITGKDNLKDGENKVEIYVTAEDRVSKKIYSVNVYRRNQIEQENYEEKEKENEEKLEEIYENEEIRRQSEEIQKENQKILENKENNLEILSLVVLAIIGGVVLIIFCIKKNLNK